jgi:hypothetical protein
VGAELFYFKNDLTANAGAFTGDQTVIAGLLNGKYYFGGPEGVFHPFIGAGAGFAGATFGGQLQGKSGGPAFQGMLGMDLRFGSHFGLYLEGKYLSSTTSDSTNQKIKVNGTGFSPAPASLLVPAIQDLVGPAAPGGDRTSAKPSTFHGIGTRSGIALGRAPAQQSATRTPSHRKRRASASAASARAPSPRAKAVQPKRPPRRCGCASVAGTVEHEKGQTRHDFARGALDLGETIVPDILEKRQGEVQILGSHLPTAANATKRARPTGQLRPHAIIRPQREEEPHLL